MLLLLRLNQVLQLGVGLLLDTIRILLGSPLPPVTLPSSSSNPECFADHGCVSMQTCRPASQPTSPPSPPLLLSFFLTPHHQQSAISVSPPPANQIARPPCSPQEPAVTQRKEPVTKTIRHIRCTHPSTEDTSYQTTVCSLVTLTLHENPSNSFQDIRSYMCVHYVLVYCLWRLTVLLCISSTE